MSEGGETVLEKLTKFVDEKIAPPLIKLGEFKYLVAMRDGIMAGMPLTIVSSFFLILANPPIEVPALDPYRDFFSAEYDLVLGLIALFVAFGTAYSLASRYNIDPLTCGIMSTITFIILAAPPAEVEGTLYLPMTFTDYKGIFTAAITAVLCVELYRLMLGKGAVIRMPKGVPPMVLQAFLVLIPMTITITIAWLISIVLGLNIPLIVLAIFTPLVIAADTLVAYLVIYELVSLLWFVGIHGDSVVGVVVGPLLYMNWLENVSAAEAGLPLPHVLNAAFPNAYQTGIINIPLSILCLRSKSRTLRSVGKVAIVPAIFNIGEPLVFGIPIMLNPLFLIPTVIYPFIGAITYQLTYWNVLPRIFIMVPWTTPIGIGTWFATRGNLLAVAWCLVQPFIITLIVYPFFKAHEEHLLQTEKEES
ncbi:MAG: PTS sugar transporter subunit IIC [Candidatus Asgardarchaeia archaeon]